MRYLVIDVETPNSANDRISSIGFVVIEDGAIVECGGSLCDPQVPFHPFNSQLTGLTAEIVAGAPTFPQLWPQLESLMEGAVLVAHNARFDLSVLCRCMSAYGIPAPPMRYCCTLEMARKAWPGLERYKLNVLCDRFSFPLDHHQAESDAMGCAQLLLEMERQGVPIHRHIKPYNPYQAGGQAPFARPRLADKTKKVNTLLSILNEIADDGQISEQEFIYLALWMDNHGELRGTYEFDQVFAAIDTILEDGFISQSELDELLALVTQIVSPVEAAGPVGKIVLDGREICLSGDFDHGSKSEIKALLERHGAIVRDRVIKTLDYLIVGGQGSSAWSSGTYGNKVKRALELQAQGAKVQIVRESDLFDQLSVKA